MTMFSEVSAMNIAFNNPFGGASNSRVIKQCAAIPEEIQELKKAHAEQNEIEIRDACCDILVFSMGALHLMGTNYDTDVGKYPRRLYLQGADIDQTILGADGLYQSLAENLEKSPEFEGIIQALLTLIDLALGLYNLFDHPDLVEEDMHAVYVSNMSKFCTNKAEEIASITKYQEMGVLVLTEGEYPTVCVKSGKDQTVDGVFYPQGKFLKGVNYKKPVFA